MKLSEPNDPFASDDASIGENPDFVVVDVETSCARVGSICQIGIVGFRDGQEVFAYETLIDPQDEFSPFNIGIHGISPVHVAGKPTFSGIHGIVAEHLTGRVTVAHSGFDKGALAAACQIGNLPYIETTWLDSVRVAKRAWPQLPNHRLNTLAQHLKIHHRHHDALSDARAAGEVIVRAIEDTGIDLQGWLAKPAKPGKAPRAADTGPLKGHRIAILGERRDGALAELLAAHGARVVSRVSSTTTMLVVSTHQPFGCWEAAQAEQRKAEKLRDAGGEIEIVTEAELRARL
ncbi:exonuclease domain-containing protein [Novosphingobium mathurense]|uniref:DNA polymerase-3 subunit epsilon n=1 Tax=Novosphingobium mathurense TaxID=428990 RepID=A0A1U6IMN1_9SPHN|nr:exonuclease domain-containing protein [Novosphingobium mathurense]SLK09285.1 DNA polymerase-3 subunit epsilon [Novosphingobium mathurense]